MDVLRLLSRSSGLKINRTQQSQSQILPSAGGKAPAPAPIPEPDNNKNDTTTTTTKKRKRPDFEDTADLPQELDEPAIHTLHKQHKIKITDLHSLHAHQADSTSGRAIKQAARLYPQPLLKFTDLKVGRALRANIAGQAYREPTEVQLATIPLLLREVVADEPDLLVVAPTGSGKTLAFLVPLVEKMRRGRGEGGKGVRALVLAPTRELVGQIVNEARKLVGGTGVRVVEMRKGLRLIDGEGGGGQEDEEGSEDEEGGEQGTVVKADVLVATPLSVVNAITKREDGTVMPLPDINTLVLDEADYLLDPLFREQVLSVWSACTSSDLRVSLWSATIGATIEELAVSTITARYESRSKNIPPLLRTIIGLKDTSLPTISHKLIYAATEPGKLMGLRQLLHPAPCVTNNSAPSSPVLRPPFIIFTQTIPRATALHEELKYDIPASAGGSSRIAVLHSNLSSTQRSKIMTEFRQGKIWILITTNLLSRGVDFRGINGVVNYDIPTTSASYVHRAGRTGRAGREGGICVTFYTREDIKYLKPIANLIAASEKKNRSDSTSGDGSGDNGVPAWLLNALPELSKQDRKELKQRGVDIRRAVKESDDKEARRRKGKNRIGTSSGYERRQENRQKGMKEGSKRRKQKDLREQDRSGDDGAGSFEGFRD